MRRDVCDGAAGGGGVGGGEEEERKEVKDREKGGICFTSPGSILQ